ncbi:WD40 repeat domain-containing protein [Candidatus Nitronereus thalassa]|uniref:WD40 repeat domain-containing protein n=1 Tax=Candidatus Nitronereus thalassa TaxID=3020898 RepID=UPI003B968522
MFIHDPRIPEGEEDLGPFSLRKGIFSLAWSPSGDRFVAGLRDRTVRLYAIQTDFDAPEPIFKELQVFQGHDGGLRSVTFSPDG